ncbi:hypothetical protein [Deinococcus yavapaiensis]|uniref:Uncharacterized protein n=1 Tax=Deinococcus yavapaiensis KR-236 TaxID=694435 RepID=A0A318SAX5_9DEIO|nr:hypothetical protein [Deinococcus yavapaiensis]PYE53391.1 hypothetical protein DES52_109168 [Deinococcus yavapaiensis KR-236]
MLSSSRVRTIFVAILVVLAFAGAVRFLNTSAQTRFLLNLTADQRRGVAEAVRALEARQGALASLYEVRLLSVEDGPPCANGHAGVNVRAQQSLLGVVPIGSVLRVSCGEVGAP